MTWILETLIDVRAVDTITKETKITRTVMSTICIITCGIWMAWILETLINI